MQVGDKIKITADGKTVNWKVPIYLLTPGHGNMKIAKSEKLGIYSTKALHLAPSTMSGYNTCPKASKGCKAVCLTYSGQGQCYRQGELYNSRVHRSRIGKTILLHEHKAFFFKKLKREIDNFIIKCTKKGTKPAIRLNCTSDLPWEKMKDPSTKKSLMELYPNVQFYDYTKILSRLNKVPENYFLNFSRSESNEKEVIKALEMGINVCVVFLKDEYPSNYKGYRIIDGDKTDLRFLDNKFFENHTGKGIVVGLKSKGWKSKKDLSGFVILPHQWKEIEQVKRMVA